MSKVVGLLFVIVAALVFFSFRLTEVPAGLTIDEAAFGYNGVLLSKTLRDENNRALPIFVLSINGKDWRQPVTQYYIAAFFKLFGPSVFNLRFTSVTVAVASLVLILLLGRTLLGTFGGVAAGIAFATIPIVMIHSHLGLDNIMPIPFVLAWLIFVSLFNKTRKLRYLCLAGVALGVGFYSYKGMRVFVPTWSLLTVIFLVWDFLKTRTKKSFLAAVKPVFAFSLSILPFFAAIPYLEFKYAGAVLNNEKLSVASLYDFLYRYLSSFDPSFLFVKGDEILNHSTGKHGMFLLTTLPFFILGLIAAFKKDKFWKFLIAALFVGPLLFGFFGVVHRASRMLAEVPIYSLILALGAWWLWKRRSLRILFAVLSILIAANFYDFLHYYWWEYGPDTKHIFYDVSSINAYKILKDESEKRGLTPLVYDAVVANEQLSDTFARSIYFLYPPSIWYGDEKRFPDNGILMAGKLSYPFLTRLEVNYQDYGFYVKKKN